MLSLSLWTTENMVSWSSNPLRTNEFVKSATIITPSHDLTLEPVPPSLPPSLVRVPPFFLSTTPTPLPISRSSCLHLSRAWAWPTRICLVFRPLQRVLLSPSATLRVCRPSGCTPQHPRGWKVAVAELSGRFFWKGCACWCAAVRRWWCERKL